MVKSREEGMRNTYQSFRRDKGMSVDNSIRATRNWIDSQIKLINNGVIPKKDQDDIERILNKLRLDD